MMKFVSHSPEDTVNSAYKIAETITPGDNICLTGPLGAGKSVICRAILFHFGVRGLMPSPTFTLINEFTGIFNNKTFSIFHVDLYRLDGSDDCINIGLSEILEGDSLSLIEWGEKAEKLYNNNLKKITISIKSESEREIIFI